MHLAYLLLFLAGLSEAFITSRGAPRISSFVSSIERKTIAPLALLSPVEELMDVVSSNHFPQHHVVSSLLLSMDAPPETAGISYSKASYYTVLGLYLMSFPGIWSQIKRSTKAKVKRKTYISPGENSGSETAKSLRQQAGEIMACEFFLCVFLGAGTANRPC